MPQFSVNIVTPAGQALLARASSALRLIYTICNVHFLHVAFFDQFCLCRTISTRGNPG
jgi:hypothetical protein